MRYCWATSYERWPPILLGFFGDVRRCNMKCHRCRFEDTKVIESRDAADGEAIRRRRECTHCQYRFTTYERLERPQLIVVKNSGSRELFSRDKLLAGLYRACEKTTVTSLQLDHVV